MKKPIIQIKHLSYQYPDFKHSVINDVNLRIFKGEWLSLIGLNGSGKSTLVKLIDGLLPAKRGQIIINQLPVSENNLLSIRSNIGIIFQDPKDQFVGVTVKDEIAFGLENQQIPPEQIKDRVLKSLSLVGMRKYYNSLVNNLSGGQQQRIAIADVIAVRPKIMILDECTSMLDPQARCQMMNLINLLKQRFNLTVIDITHNISETKYAQRIAIMNHGRIVMNGTPDEVFQQRSSLRRLRLALPPADILSGLLRKRGLKIPDKHFNETRLLSWLGQLFLNT